VPRPRAIWAIAAVAAAAAITGAIILSGQGSGRGSRGGQPLRPAPTEVSRLIDDWWRGDKTAALNVGVAAPKYVNDLFNASQIELPDKSTRPGLEHGQCDSNAPDSGYTCSYDYRPKSGGTATVSLTLYQNAAGYYVASVYAG
jgi:hypothetical protein